MRMPMRLAPDSPESLRLAVVPKPRPRKTLLTVGARAINDPDVPIVWDCCWTRVPRPFPSGRGTTSPFISCGRRSVARRRRRPPAAEASSFRRSAPRHASEPRA